MKASLVIFVSYLSVSIKAYKDSDVDGYFAKENENERVKPRPEDEENLSGLTGSELAASRQVEEELIIDLK